jgi:hypothetical protein
MKTKKHKNQQSIFPPVSTLEEFRRHYLPEESPSNYNPIQFGQELARASIEMMRSELQKSTRQAH